MLEFPLIDPDEQRVLTFNFINELGAGEVLFALPYEGFLSGPNVSVVCSAGSDPNPSQILIAPAAYDAQWQLILQPVGNLHTRLGNDYIFEASSATSEPNKVVVIRALLSVRIS